MEAGARALQIDPLLHAGVDAFEHGGAAGQQDVAVHLAEQVLAIWQTVKPAHCAL